MPKKTTPHVVRRLPTVVSLQKAHVPATLEEYYAHAAAIGFLAAQIEQPDPALAVRWSLDFGESMAAEARRRRKKKR